MKTKSVKVDGFVIARQYAWEDAPVLELWSFAYDKVYEHCVHAVVCPVSVTVTVPENLNETMTAGAVKGIRAQLEAMKEEYHQKCAALNARLAEIQCLEFKK